MTTETWLWILGGLIAVIMFWLRDWKEKIEQALAVKQKKLDEHEETITELKVVIAGCVRHEELNALRLEIAGSFRAEVDRLLQVLQGAGK